jgi:hypothetical protein
MTTDTSEHGPENLIVEAMTGLSHGMAIPWGGFFSIGLNMRIGWR